MSGVSFSKYNVRIGNGKQIQLDWDKYEGFRLQVIRPCRWDEMMYEVIEKKIFGRIEKDEAVKRFKRTVPNIIKKYKG